MKKEDLITLPNPHLREKSERVHVITDDVRALIENMINVSIDWEDSRPYEISAALAAIQIDSPFRVIIVRSDFDDKAVREFTPLINPEIVKGIGPMVADYEGCLSVKECYGKVPRYSKVRVKAMDINGHEIRIKAEGFLARVLQHEIDHCNGLTFVDRIKDDHTAFYRLNNKGDLDPLDYNKTIKNNHNLWR